MIIENASGSNRIARRLRDQGYRLTPQRMAIVDVVMSSKSHPTAEEIHQRITADFPMISLATVYKTLNVLKELGEVVELRVNGCGHYENAIQPHPHLVCVQCHAIVDLPPEELTDISERTLSEARFRPLRYNIEIYGLCSECQEKEEASELLEPS